MSDERPPTVKRGERVTCPSGHLIATVVKDFWQLYPLLERFFDVKPTSDRCGECGQRWFRKRELLICIAGEWRKSDGRPA